MREITIQVGQGHKSKTQDHLAAFTVVREVRGYALGWAKVDGIPRFPVIVCRKFGDIYTVYDWQAPYQDYDLSDPEDFAVLMSSHAESFVIARTGSPTTIVRHFLP